MVCQRNKKAENRKRKFSWFALSNWNKATSGKINFRHRINLFDDRFFLSSARCFYGSEFKTMKTNLIWDFDWIQEIEKSPKMCSAKSKQIMTNSLFHGVKAQQTNWKCRINSSEFCTTVAFSSAQFLLLPCSGIVNSNNRWLLDVCMATTLCRWLRHSMRLNSA